MKKFCFINILIFACIFGLRAQVPQHISDSLQNVLNIQQGINDIPGISAAVNIHNVGIWTGTTGESYANTSLSPDMLLGIGSNTKLFTSTLMLKLVEQEIVSLDDSLHHWLPTFNNIDSTITIKQLLRHNSGLADFWTTSYVNAIFSHPDSVWTPEDVLSFVGPPLFAPGAGVSYSNANFTLAGMIIEAATGQKYHTLIRDSILTPLNLSNTFLEGFETITAVSAHPWHLGNDVYLVPRTAVTTAAFSAGCIKSTPEDMVIWYDQLFNRGFLTINSFAELTDFINVSGSSVNGVGCGIFRMNYDSRTYYVHSGNIRGYSSYTMYDTQDKHSISVLRNDTFIDCENVIKALARALNALITTVEENQISQVANQFQLFQNYPNPFNSTTVIKYNLSKESTVRLVIYNINGQSVKMLVNKNQSVGVKSFIWDGTNNFNEKVGSGVYFYRLIIGNRSINNQSRKMLLIN